MALGPGLPTRMVCPSPLLRTTSDVPMVPPPPDLFSTIADWPQAVCRCTASIRPITSVLPPAAAGTMRRTVSVGRQSAPKLARGKMAAAETAAAPVNTRRREINLVTVRSLLRLLFCGERRECAGGRQADGLAQAYYLVTFPGCCAARRLRRGALLIRGPSVIVLARVGPALRSSAKALHRVRDTMLVALVEAQQLEQRRQVAELLARCRRGAADEVEYLAVLQPVIGEPLHLAVPVKIDRDHPLVHDLLVHERDRALGALRDVIEDFAVEGRDRGWRSHHDQHLILACPDRNLLERAGGEDIALLKLLAGAGAQHRAHQSDGGDGAHAAPARSQAARRHAGAGLAYFGHSGTGPVPLHRARR